MAKERPHRPESPRVIDLPEPCEREKRAITEAATRRIARRKRLSTRMVEEGGVMKIGANHTDAEGWCWRALDAFGTSSGDFTKTEIARIGTALNTREEGGHQCRARRSRRSAAKGSRWSCFGQ